MGSGWFFRQMPLIAGLLYGFISMLGDISHSRFERIPGDLGDSRLINLFLEHVYQWLRSFADHSLFSPTWMMYPYKNGFALSDTMIAAVPFYAPFRILGFNELTAFQGWIITCAFLNYGTMYWLLRRWDASRLAAAAGAVIFAFSIPRFAYLNHPQLLFHFIAPLILVCLDAYWSASHSKRGRWLVVASILLAIQFYGSIYHAWFFAFGCLLAIIPIMLVPQLRISLLADVRSSWKWYVIAAASFLLVFTPLYLKFHITIEQVGERGFTDVQIYLPNAYTLFLSHPSSVFYGWLDYQWIAPYRDMTDWPEKVAWAGALYLVGVLVVIGIVLFRRSLLSMRGRRRRLVAIMSFVWVMMTVLPLQFADGDSMWRAIVAYVPGASGIRAAGRISLTAVIPGAVLLAAFIDCMRNLCTNRAWSTGLGTLLLAIVMIENFVNADYSISKSEHYGRIQSIAAVLHREGQQKNCRVFVSKASGPGFAVSIDAMWLSLQTRIPTVNGYSGGYPKGWDFGVPEQIAQDQVQKWLAMKGKPLADEEICVLTP